MSELVRHFGLDVRLLAAQAINFAVLFFVLNRFAFQPALEMLRKRRRGIEEGVKMRREAEEQLKRMQELYQRELAAARAQAYGIVSGAEEQARRREEEIAAEAARKNEQVVADAKRLIRQEQAKMVEQFAGDAAALVRLSIERVLGKMPPAQRDQGLIDEAVQEAKAVLRK